MSEELLARAFSLFTKHYEEAKNNPRIRKPISWALYETWKVVDCIEIMRGE